MDLTGISHRYHPFIQPAQNSTEAKTSLITSSVGSRRITRCSEYYRVTPDTLLIINTDIVGPQHQVSTYPASVSMIG